MTNESNADLGSKLYCNEKTLKIYEKITKVNITGNLEYGMKYNLNQD
jgi:hypothetical protein